MLAGPVRASEADDFKAWINLNKQLVDNGQMKRSDFYKEMYYRVSQLKAIEDKSNMLLATNLLIKSSEDLEAGKISMQEFNSTKRDALAIWSKPGVHTPTDRPAPAVNLLGNQINCTSTPMGNTVNTKCW